jgi:hypothetical protein
MCLTTAVAAAILVAPRRLELPLVVMLCPVALEKAAQGPLARGYPKGGENVSGAHLGTVPAATGGEAPDGRWA